MTDDTPNDQPSNVVPFPGDTVEDVPVKKVLEKIAECEHEVIVAITVTKDENNLRVYTSSSDGMEILWLLEVAKQQLLNMSNGELAN